MLLDEPFSAVDVHNSNVTKLIVNLQQENNITICICDHIATSLLQIVDTAMILVMVKLLHNTLNSLIKNINAKNAYLVTILNLIKN